MYPGTDVGRGRERLASYDSFRAYIGERFRVYGGTGAREVVSLRLIEVSERHRDTHAETFSVRFQGPPDRPCRRGFTPSSTRARAPLSYFWKRRVARRTACTTGPASTSWWKTQRVASLNEWVSG